MFSPSKRCCSAWISVPPVRMAATLGSLRPPLLPIPNHNHKCLLPNHPLPQLFNPAKFGSFLFKEDHGLPLQLPALQAPILPSVQSVSLPLMAVALPFFIGTKDALAVEGEFGILEGRTLSLIHPLVMGSLFVYTLWAGYLGWQWRRVRTIQEEINDLKKQVKPAAVTPDRSPPPELPPPSQAELKIQQLTEERKELIKGSFRDRHYNAGSILLGFGVFESVGGGVNTWFRTGKLFPGPHLFAGAGITVLWALAASLVPAMQKGNETARNLHIALNLLNVTLFIWQIPTGIDIVFKVLEFTQWP